MPPPLPKTGSSHFRNSITSQDLQQPQTSRQSIHAYKDSRWNLPLFEPSSRDHGRREQCGSDHVNEGIKSAHVGIRRVMPFQNSLIRPSVIGIQAYDQSGSTEQNNLPLSTLQLSSKTSNYFQSQHIAAASDYTRAYSMMPFQARQNSYSHRPSLNGLSFIERPHRVTDHQPLYQSPNLLPNKTDSQSPPSIVSISRNSLGLLQRPEIGHISRGNFPGRPQSDTFRSHSKFPQNLHASDMSRRSDEQTLQNIPGVRGMSSHSAQKYGNEPSYADRRPLFTSSGGRRSVRR